MDSFSAKGPLQLGRIASAAVAVEVFLFAVFLVVAMRYPAAELASFLICFLLAPSVVVMTACVHATAENDRKVWSLTGLVFAAVYAVFCTLTYYVQWVFVRPNQLILPIELARLLSFKTGTLMFAVDMLGYGFLCLSVLFTSGAFRGAENRWVKIFYVVNGVLFLPTLIYPGLGVAQDTGAVNPADYFGSFALLFWCFLFAPLAVLTADYFNRMLKKSVDR